MGGSRVCTSQITQQLMKLNLYEAPMKVEPKISLKTPLGAIFWHTSK
jgi:hypothetical protein